MRIGQRVSWIRDDIAPLKSPNTDLVIAWLTCGGQLVPDGAYLDTVEKVGDDTKRTVTWCIEGDVKVNFEVKGQREEIDFEEFRRRFLDADWFRANLDHPIAYLKQYRDNSQRVRAWLKDQRPAALVKRGNRTAIIPADCPEARRQKILAEL